MTYPLILRCLLLKISTTGSIAFMSIIDQFYLRNEVITITKLVKKLPKIDEVLLFYQICDQTATLIREISQNVRRKRNKFRYLYSTQLFCYLLTFLTTMDNISPFCKDWYHIVSSSAAQRFL